MSNKQMYSAITVPVKTCANAMFCLSKVLSKRHPGPDQPGGGHDVTSSAVTNANQGPEIAGRGPRSTTHPLILIPLLFMNLSWRWKILRASRNSFDNLQISKCTGFWQQSSKLYNLSVWPCRPGCEASPWKCNSLVSLFAASLYLFCSQLKPSFFKTWFWIVAFLDFGEILLLASDLTFTLLFNLTKKKIIRLRFLL